MRDARSRAAEQLAHRTPTHLAGEAVARRDQIADRDFLDRPAAERRSIGVTASKDEKPEIEQPGDGAGLRVGGRGFFTAFTAQDDMSVTRS